MESKTEELKKSLRQLGTKIGDEKFVQKFSTALEDMLEKGKLPKEALNITDENMELYYAQAYRLYNSGKYIESSAVFRMLIFLDATQARFAMGLAACAHMLKDYDAAIKMYTMCGILDANDPLPPFHASDCYIQKNDRPSAMLMLEMAILRAGNKPEYQVLKDRAVLTLAGLEKELAK